MKFEDAVELAYHKREGNLTEEDREILLLDTYYFLENENYHSHIENLEALTGKPYKELEKKLGETYEF